MSDASTTCAGDGYLATPIVEPWGDAGWKAGVLLSGGDARGDRPAKSRATSCSLRAKTPGSSPNRSTARSAASTSYGAGAWRRAGKRKRSRADAVVSTSSASRRWRRARAVRAGVWSAMQSRGTTTS